MDTQRLILFVVFSFSALMLWEAWQKEYRAAPAGRGRHAGEIGAPADLPPSPSVPAVPSATPALPSAPTPPAADRESTAAATHDHDRHRPLSRGDRHHRRRDHAGRPPQASAIPATKQALPRAPQDARADVRRAVGTARRGHAESPNRYTAEPGPRDLAPGTDRIVLRLQSAAPNGDRVVQTLTFHRGTYVIDVAYDVTNAAAAPHRAVRLFPVHARYQDAGRAELDGADVVHRPGHLQRDRQVQESRFLRPRQARRRSLPQAAVHEERRQRLGRRWSSTTSSPHGCRRREEDAAASSTRASSTAASTRRA